MCPSAQVHTAHLFYSPKIFIKDLPLLDYVGWKYPYRNPSFVLGNRIHRLVQSTFNFYHLKPERISILSRLATWLTSAGATTVGGWKYLSSNATWQYPETPIWNATSLQIQQNPGEASISSPISSFLQPSDNMTPFELSQSNFWEYVVIPTSLILSLAVNTLVTGLIVFKILKVFLEIKAVTSSTSVERTLGVSSTGGGSAKYRHIIFVIIESGMALFAIQLIRVLFYYYLPMQSPPNLINILIVINQMFNVNIFIRFVFISNSFFCFTD